MAEIKRYGRPNERTVGEIGDIYTNTNTNEQFKCVDTYEIRTHDGVITYYVWVSTRVNTGDSGNSGGNSPGGDVIAQPSPAIIDVYELPTENINENVFYRLMKGEIYFGAFTGRSEYVVHCVEKLPMTGKPVTIDRTNLDVYYSKQDDEAYGYIDPNLSAFASIPVGWYTLTQLAPAFEIDYGGIVKNKNSIPDDGIFRVLIEYAKYEYKNGWRELPNVYQPVPEIDIRWDGDMTDRFALDLSMLGYDAGLYMVKVSDAVLTAEQLAAGSLWWSENDNEQHDIIYEDIEPSFMPGVMAATSHMCVVYAQEETNAAMGLPEGTITNGTYFTRDNNFDSYVLRFITPYRTMKIDPKFLPDEIGGGVYWDDVMGDRSGIRTDLYVYSKSEVDTLISNAIGKAIGGSY